MIHLPVGRRLFPPRLVPGLLVGFGCCCSGAAIAATPSPGGNITATSPTGGATSISEDATAPVSANIRISPTTLADTDAGETPDSIRLISITGGTIAQGDGTPITLGASGTVLVLTASNYDARFTPSANRDTAATLQYVVVDEGGVADSAQSTITVNINPVNDAPTITAGTLAAVTEDNSDPAGASITLLFGGSFSDVDSTPASSLEGIAITADPNITSQGAWQYSPDAGNNWFAVTDPMATALSTTNALYLDVATHLRFVPAPNFDGAVSPLTVRALDNTNAVAFSDNSGPNETRVTNNVSSNGGATPISATAVSLNTSITPVNDAPGIGNGTLASVAEDNTNPAGATITSLFSASFSDPDTVPAASLSGIAVTGDPANAAQGAWQYSPDAGVNWFPVSNGAPTLGNSNALYLSAATRVRFLPALNFSGAVTALTVRGLDNTNALAFSSNTGATESRQIHNVTTNGGASAIAAATDQLNTSITAVNDAPTLTNGTLTAVAEDNTNPAGATITALFGAGFTDVDGSMAGIAVTGDPESAAQGSWQYSPNGTNWFDISDGVSTLSDSIALYLSAATRIRFVPALNYDGAVTALTVRGLDNTNALAFSSNSGATETRQTHNASSNGGSTPISAGTALLNTSITAQNDDPTYAMFPGSPQTVDEDTDLIFNNVNSNRILLADPDIGGADIRATLSATNGTLTLGGTTGLTTVSGNGTATVLLEGSLSEVNQAMDGLAYRATLNFSGSATLQATINDLGNTGTGGGGNVVTSATITVSAVNDSPTFALFPGVAQSVNEDTNLVFSGGNGNRISFADVDIAASDLRATLAVSNGTITLGGTTGLTSVSGNGTATVMIEGPLTQINSAVNNLIYRGTLNFNGADSLMVTINDLGHTGTGGGGNVSMPVGLTVNPLNDMPVQSQNSTLSVNQGGTAVISSARLSFSDVDDTTSALTYTVVTPPANGSINLGATFTQADINASAVTYTHNGTATTTDSFVFNVRDDDLATTANATFNITINSTPTVTTPIADVLVNESAPNTVISLLTSFDDAEDGAGGLTYTIQTTSGAAVFNGTPAISGGNLTIAYLPNTPGVATITIRATDSRGAFTDDTFQVTVNDRPVANPDAGNTNEGTATTVDVLLNDTDSDGTLAPASVSVTSAPANGSTMVNPANGRITYTPAGDFNGTDSFQYTANDNRSATSNSATVTVTVNAVNDGPGLGVPGATQAVSEGGTLTLSAANGNPITITDVDADETALPVGGVRVTLAATKGTLTLAATDGLVNLTGNTTANVTFDGTVSGVNNALNGLIYAPNALVNGAETLTVTVNDKGNTGAGGVLMLGDTIDVNIASTNNPPVVTVPGAQTLDEDTVTGISGISVADPDAGSGSVTVTLSVAQGRIAVNTAAAGGVPAGSITGNDTNAVILAGTLVQLNNTLPTTTFITASNIVAPQTLVVSANDNGNSGGGAQTDSENVAITVTPQNDNPTFSNFPGAQLVGEDTPRQFSTANGNRITLSDVDLVENNPGGTIRAALTVGSGTLTLNGTAGLGSVLGDGTASVTIVGPLTNVNNALNGMTYRGAQDFNGADTLLAVINDLSNTGAGGGIDVSMSAGITVNPVNDAPAITVPSAQAADENANFPFSVADGNAITITDADADEAAGELVLTMSVANGTLMLADTSGLSANTGNGTGSLSATGTLSALAAAVDGLVYRGNLNFNGSDTLNLNIDDQGNSGGGAAGTDSESVTITVEAVNNPPQLVLPGAQTISEDATTGITGISASDVDAASGNLVLTLSVGAGKLRVDDTVAGGVQALAIGNNNTSTVTLTGTLGELNTTLPTLTFTTALNNRTNQTLSVSLNDQGNTGLGGSQIAAGNVALNITALNDNPVLDLPGTQAINEESALNFSTANGNALSVSDVDVAETPGQLRMTLSAAHGRLTLATTAGITLVTGTGTGDVTVTFAGVASAINTALNGLVYQPDANFNTDTGQSEALTVTVNDQGFTGQGGGANITGSVPITIAALNDNPVLTVPNARAVTEDVNLSFSGNLVVSDVDEEENPGGVLEVTLSAAQGTVTLASTAGLNITAPATGTADADITFSGTEDAVNAALNGLLYRGDPDFNGNDALSVTVNDLGNTGTGGATDVGASVPITVTPVNDPPVASDVLLSPTEPLRNENLNATYTFADVDGDVESGTTIRWFRDDVLQTSFNNLPAIPMASTVEGEVWFFRVTPSDGVAAGPEVQSNSVTIRPVADLQIFIARDPGQVVPGEGVTYTIQARNLGPSPVIDAAVATTLPAALQNVQWSCAACGASGTGPIAETLDLAAGQTVEYVLSADVNPAATGDLAVSATLQGPALVFETNDADNSDTDTVPLMPEASLSVTMTADRESAQPGDVIVYTVTATNQGPSEARGVFFSDTPDSNTELFPGSVTTTRGTVVSGNDVGDGSVAISVGTLPRDATVDIIYSVVVDNPFPAEGQGMVCTRGLFSGEAGNPDVNFPDAQPAAEVCTAVAVLIDFTATNTDLLLVDANADGTANPGDTLRYTVQIANGGNGGANNVIYSQPAIANGNLIEDSITTVPDGAVINLNAGALSVNLGSIQGGDGNNSSATIRYDVSIVNPLPPGESLLVCQGAIDYDERPATVDPIRTDDPDAVVIEGSDIIMIDGDGNIVRPAPTVTRIVAAPSLVVRKSDDIARAEEKRPGDVIAYTVSIENRGNLGALDLAYRTRFRDNEISQAELLQVDGSDPLSDVAASLLSNFNALDADDSGGLSSQELAGSFFALTEAQFNALDTTDARVSLVESSILVNGNPQANEGSRSELLLSLGSLNGRNPDFTNGPTVNISFSVQINPVLRAGVNLILCQGMAEGANLSPVSSDDPETINSAPDATQTTVRALPELTIVPEILTIDFGDQDIDDGPTPVRTVELTNTSAATADLTFSFVGLEGASLSDFVVVSDTDEDALAPGATRIIEIAFDPRSIGNKRASFRIESDDPDDSAVDVNLSGRALDSDIRVTPGSLDFGKRNLLAGPSSPQSVSIINDGLGALTLNSVTLACGPDIFPVMTEARFEELDLNGDGALSRGIGMRRELEDAIDLFDLAEVLIEEFAGLDTDASLVLSPAEVDPIFPFLTLERFDALDEDSTGELDPAELDAALELAAFSESLLNSFDDFDINLPEGLDFSEAQSILPDLTEIEFLVLDADGNGVLARNELDERTRLAILATQLQVDFSGLDADRNNALSMEEINTFVPLLTPGRFAAIDSDADEELSTAELEAVTSVLADSLLSQFSTLDTDASGGLTIGESNATCSFEILSDSGEGTLETAQSRLVRIVFDPSTEGVKVGTLRIEANQEGQGTPVVSKVSLFGIGNRTPRIVGQNPVTTAEDTPVAIILDNLVVDSPLLDLPDEVTLAFQPLPEDANYTRDGNSIIPNANFNGVLFVPVTVRDGSIDSNVWDLRIDVTKSNDAPTGITLDNNTILENQVLDTVVGRFTTADPDLGDLHLYSLVPDDPATDDDDFVDNEYFGIVANQLVSRIVLDFETRDSYTVLVRSRDPEGLAFERAFSVEVTDQPNDEDNAVAAEVLLDNFDDVDSNDDGILTFEETLLLLPGFTQNRFDSLNTEIEISETEIQLGISYTAGAQTLFDAFDLTDTDGNGALTLAEARGRVPGLTQEAFDYMNLDGDDSLTPGELQSAILLFNDLDEIFSDFDSLDTDGSGSLTLDELPDDLTAINQQNFEALDSNPGLSPRELESQVQCVLVEGSVVLVQPAGDLLAPPQAEVLDVIFNAEADVNVTSACSAGDIEFTYAIGAESILITDLAEYFLQNFTSLDADFNNGLSEAEVEFSRIGITPARFDILDFDGDGNLAWEELEAAVILSDLASALLQDFATLNTDNSTGLSFAEAQPTGPDLDELRYDLLDLNDNGVLTRQELEAEIDLPDFLLENFVTLDANTDGALSLAEIHGSLPGLSQTRFDNLDANRDGLATPEEIQSANDFEKAMPAFAVALPADEQLKQIRGNAPATFTLPVNNAYRVRVTATLTATGQTIQSGDYTFEIRNGTDNDNNGYIDFPYEELVNDGSRWERSVGSVDCDRAVLMHAWQGANIPGRDIEAVVVNPANPQQRVSLRVPHGLAEEGEEAVLIAAIACSPESLYTRALAEQIEALPEDAVAGMAWVSLSIIVRQAGAPEYAPVSNARLAQRPVAISLNRLNFSPEDNATFFLSDVEVLSDETNGIRVEPVTSAWSAAASQDALVESDVLSANLARLGTVVALESLKPPILSTTPDGDSPIDLGPVRVNESLERTVTVTNLGGERLVGTAELRDATGVFALIGEASFNLGHGETHQFLIRFSPANDTAYAASLTFSGDPEGPVTVALTGTGTPAKGLGCGPADHPGEWPLGNLLVVLLTLGALCMCQRPGRSSAR